MSEPKRWSLPSVVALAGLVTIFLAAALVFTGGLALDTAKVWMLIGTVVWFAAAPLWLLRRSEDGGDQAV